MGVVGCPRSETEEKVEVEDVERRRSKVRSF